MRRDAYTAPSEERGQTGEGLQPGENGGTVGRQVDVCDEGEHHEGDSGDERATGTVNVGEDAWSIALLGQSGQAARTTVNTGVTDGED